MSDPEPILRACSLFHTVEESGWMRLRGMARSRSARKGAVLFRQGDPCPGIFVVGKGLVRLYTLAPSGKDHVLHMAGAGQAFAEVAVIGGFPCPATAEVVQAATLALLPAGDFMKAIREDHGLCLQLMAGVTLRVRHFLTLLEDMVLRDASGRLARYLLDVERGPGGEITLPSLKRHLASHLNLTSETFSRILRRLGDSGLIESRGGRRIRVLDPDGLAAIAEGLSPLV